MNEQVEQPRDPSKQQRDAREAGRWATQVLVRAGKRLGLTPIREYPVPGGRIDVVWLTRTKEELPGWEGDLPLVGFEVESSWRTRKHIKGDLLNLQELGAALGVIVLLGDDERMPGLRRFAESLVERPQTRVLIWSEDELRQVDTDLDAVESASETATRLQEQEPGDPVPTSTTHVGKYRALWDWLRQQTKDEVELTFAEIEEILGFGLPPTSYRHPAHWHSYEGSAVSRAIIDAGWRATGVSLSEERVRLRREIQ